MNYKQCSLEKKYGKETKMIVSWIPINHAIKNKIVKLQDRDTKEWEDGWRVALVGTKVLTHEQIVEQSQFCKTQREASDV